MEEKKQIDKAYWERNQLVAALSKLFPSHLAKHPESDPSWEDDWRTIVVIKIPNKTKIFFYDGRDATRIEDVQLTWHIHDSEISMFDHLEYDTRFVWDGHTTEEKYKRLRRIFLEEYFSDIK